MRPRHDGTGKGRSRLIESAALVGALVVAACAPSRSGAQPGTDADLQRQLTLPAGLRIEYFAHLDGARWMTLGPDGSVYVSLPQRGEVVHLFALNREGRPDSQVVVAHGLNEPHGMAFHKQYFYVADNDGVVRFALDARGVPTGSPTAVNHYGGGSGHSTRTIVFGADSAMYVSDGSSCNVCVEHDSTRATVLRFDEDGGNGRVFASGLRNAVGVAVNPATGEIWVTVNERDNLEPDHQNSPPDKINIIHAGGFYGWPYCWGSRNASPEFHDPARCAAMVVPALNVQAHSAVLGITFLDRATALPAAMRGDALVASHGSWNRDVPTGDKIIRVHIANGQPQSYDDFITGWQRPDGSRWGRVADVMVAADGSLLITDDKLGAIYRVFSSSAP
jgi:glucose/arabinose dehydrogenase